MISILKYKRTLLPPLFSTQTAVATKGQLKVRLLVLPAFRITNHLDLRIMNIFPSKGVWDRGRLLFPLALLFFSLLSASPVFAQGQAKQPTLSDKVTKIAYVDHARLRGEYRALKAAREKARAEWQASEQGHQKQLAGLSTKNEAGREALEQNQQERRRQLHQKRVAALQAHERRITETIGETVSQGGFTDVKPLEKGGALSQGQDITDLVLKKLN